MVFLFPITCAQVYLTRCWYTFKVPMSIRNIFIIIAACVAVLAFIYLFFVMKAVPTLPGGTQPAPAAASPQTSAPQTLGSAIYEGAANPIQNKLPDVNPVSNPVQGLYQNPFE